MGLKKYWGCMHDNPHPQQMEELGAWYEHMKQGFDFWPIAYYPFGMVPGPAGTRFVVEDLYPEAVLQENWEAVQQLVERAESEGYPMFLGYEWQGAGLDGDHNVFFLASRAPMLHPRRYRELKEALRDYEAIAIPHHLAYQEGHRGKNWETHDEEFSPFAEIYSSHGSSDRDGDVLEMKRHIHMGPRVSRTTYSEGLRRGIRVGCMASGDNHVCPGQFDYGSVCVLAKSKRKEDLWEAFRARRVYGVSFGRMAIDCQLDGEEMGSVLPGRERAKLCFRIEGDAPIHRVELYRDERLVRTLTHAGTWEERVRQQGPEGRVMELKCRLELGWGPDLRIFPDMDQKVWEMEARLEGQAQFLGVACCWNHLGQHILRQEPQCFAARLTTYQSTGSGKWMGASSLQTEGFVFTIRGKAEDRLLLRVNGREFVYPLRDLLSRSFLEADLEGARELIAERFGDFSFYRQDSWWHNAYKMKLHQAAPKEAYFMEGEVLLDTRGAQNVRLKVFQENGAVAWLSPFFLHSSEAPERGGEA